MSIAQREKDIDESGAASGAASGADSGADSGAASVLLCAA